MKTIVLNNSINGQIFYENIGFQADTVIIDPDYWLITKNNASHKITDTITGQNIIQVFPNPVHDNLFIYFRNYIYPTALLTMVNSAGQLIWQKSISINGSEFTGVSMNNLPKGVYILSVSSGNDVRITRRIVKQ